VRPRADCATPKLARRMSRSDDGACLCATRVQTALVYQNELSPAIEHEASASVANTIATIAIVFLFYCSAR
jgi:hypothetical protein